MGSETQQERRYCATVGPCAAPKGNPYKSHLLTEVHTSTRRHRTSIFAESERFRLKRSPHLIHFDPLSQAVARPPYKTSDLRGDAAATGTQATGYRRDPRRGDPSHRVPRRPPSRAPRDSHIARRQGDPHHSFQSSPTPRRPEEADASSLPAEAKPEGPGGCSRPCRAGPGRATAGAGRPPGLPPQRGGRGQGGCARCGGGSARRHPVEEVAAAARENEEAAAPAAVSAGPDPLPAAPRPGSARPASARRSRPTERCLPDGSLPAAAAAAGGAGRREKGAARGRATPGER